LGEILPLLRAWTDDDLRVLGDLGYEGEQATITVAFQETEERRLHRHPAAVQPSPQRGPRYR
jgi:hypothetical protein